MTTKQRYLFAMVDAGGTVPPELAVARRLLARGHEVTVLGEHSMEPEVRAAGATFEPWTHAPNRSSRRPEDDPFRDWECKNPMQLIDRLLDTALATPAPAYARDVRDAIARLSPDTVVCSQFALGAMIGSESLGVPFFVLMPNVYLMPAEGMPPFGMGLPPAKGPLGRTRDRLISALTSRMWDKGLPRLNALRGELGLEPLEHFFDQVRHARRQLVLTSPSFDFPARFPENVRYVGPVLDDPSWVEPCELPSGEEPLVLVALSSTFQDHAACLQRIATALGTLPVRGLLTTGPAVDPASVRAPENVKVVRSAPHAHVLEHASAVVTHGGHGTVIKSLAAGVPLVVIAHGRDQADNAKRVTTRGAGIARKRSASPDAIAKAVREVLEQPRYREAAAALGRSIRSDAAHSRVVDELESHRRGDGISCTAQPLPSGSAK